MMKLRLESWNVRGLESLDLNYIIKIFMMENKGVDILMMQEVKVVGFGLEISLKYI